MDIAAPPAVSKGMDAEDGVVGLGPELSSHVVGNAMPETEKPGISAMPAPPCCAGTAVEVGRAASGVSIGRGWAPAASAWEG